MGRQKDRLGCVYAEAHVYWGLCGHRLINVSVLLATAVASPGKDSEDSGWPTQPVGPQWAWICLPHAWQPLT